MDEIPLSLPEAEDDDAAFVLAALHAPRRARGPFVERFESAFAARSGRAHGVAVASGTLGTLLALRALGIGAGDEVITSPLAWHEVAQAVVWAGATPVCSEIDYWSGNLDPARAEARVTPRTRAVLAGNVNGHPADWDGLAALARAHALTLIEDSTEAIGSAWRGRSVGGFGEVSVFDFSAPGVIDLGGGGMLLTDDAHLAAELRHLRELLPEQRGSVSLGARVPLQAGMPELGAALGLAMLQRLDAQLERRAEVERCYLEELQAFEGIKPPFVAEGVSTLHRMVHAVHLGKRFTASARRQMIDDLAAQGVESAPYGRLLHEQFAWQGFGVVRGALPLAERIGERMLALPFHAALSREEVRFIVTALKDAATNVGAGAAIYL